MAAVSILETCDLTKEYGGVTANDHVSISLERGKTTALIGPNGAGKSTFVGLVSGRIPASSGEVWFDGHNISALPAHRRMGLGMAYTFQITSVFAGLSLWENVALAARRAPAGHRDLPQRTRRALTQVGLLERASEIAEDQSYGHQRLLEIAMGIAQEPRLFILDEPTQGLAHGEIEAFLSLIREMRGDATILLIEHNMDVVRALADHIIVLDQGRVLAQGSAEEIHANAAVQAAYLGTSPHREAMPS